MDDVGEKKEQKEERIEWWMDESVKGGVDASLSLSPFMF